jgi:membrane peptidoglycan carboxypeptidase
MAESALMAGLIQLPATYDPVVNREESFARLDDVVSQMLDVNCLQFQHGNWPSQGPFCINESITVNDPGLGTQPLIRLDDQGKVNSGIALLQMAAVQVAEYRPREITVRYPHFVNLVQSQLEQQFDAAEIFRRGFTIHTTLLPHIQDAAEDALTRGMSRLQNTGVNTGSIVVTDPNTGAVRAMVGSPDFANDEIDGQVNGALTFQQPGSSIKLVVYTAALEGVDRNGDGRLSSDEYLTPASILWDVPTTYPTIPPYTPVNFDRRFHGPISVRSALQNSYNVAAVKAFDFIGPEKFTDVASRLGLRFAEGAEVGLASALGANDVLLIDMMKAYGTLANGGQSIPLIVIEQVTEKANDGSERLVTLPERPQAQQVISPQVAYLMQSILSDDTARAEAFGTNSALTLPGFPTRDWVAVKTGTSNGSRDLWTMGFTRNFVVGVWLGTVDNSETFGASGFTAAAPVWQEVMNAAMARVPGDARGPFRNPGGLVAPEVCGDTGTLADANCITRKAELVIQSQMPPPADQAFVQTIEVDTWTQLRSNEFCPESTEVKTFANIGDPTAVSWLNNTGEGRAFAGRIGLPIPMENAPVAACELGTVRPTARIIQPFGNQTITGTVPVTGQVTAPDFNRYQLEYASVQAPDNFQIIGDFSTTQQPNAGSVLGQWDTTTVPNGTYIVRLMAFSNSGGWVQHAVQPVNINNAQPTPVPVIQPTPAGISTPLPFDPVGTPTLASQVLPLATPTLDPLR